MIRRVAVFLLFTPMFAAPMAAQSRQGVGARPGRLEAQADAPMRRQQLEQQLRQGLWRIAKQRIGLSDEQMSRLEQTSQRFDGRRRALVMEERAQRLTLRDEILADGKADQDRVAKALDRLLQLQRDRIELQAEEQKEFATFMTPIQRAKYAALQEQVRRRVEALRRQRPDSAPGVGTR
jgi:periplasmic protein CpxP/Spy